MTNRRGALSEGTLVRCDEISFSYLCCCPFSLAQRPELFSLLRFELLFNRTMIGKESLFAF